MQLLQQDDVIKNGSLLKAVKTGDLNFVKQFFFNKNDGHNDIIHMQEQFSINSDISGFGTGRNALSFAAEHGQLSIVSFLLENSANPNGRDSHGLHPLLYASAKAGNKPVVQKLIQYGAVDRPDDHGISALHKAVAFANVDVLRLLLKSNGDANQRLPVKIDHDSDYASNSNINPDVDENKNNMGDTPLHLAVRQHSQLYSFQDRQRRKTAAEAQAGWIVDTWLLSAAELPRRARCIVPEGAGLGRLTAPDSPPTSPPR